MPFTPFLPLFPPLSVCLAFRNTVVCVHSQRMLADQQTNCRQLQGCLPPSSLANLIRRLSGIKFLNFSVSFSLLDGLCYQCLVFWGFFKDKYLCASWTIERYGFSPAWCMAAIPYLISELLGCAIRTFIF